MAKTGNVLLGLAAGLAVGVAVGVLFAPDKGEETRKKIKDGVSDKADKLKRKLEKLTQEVREKSGEVKENLEEKVENLLGEKIPNWEIGLDRFLKEMEFDVE